MSYRVMGEDFGPPDPPFFTDRRESVYTSSFALPYYACFQTCADERRLPVSYCRVACSAGTPMPHPPMGQWPPRLRLAEPRPDPFRLLLAEPRPDPRYLVPMGQAAEEELPSSSGPLLLGLGILAVLAIGTVALAARRNPGRRRFRGPARVRRYYEETLPYARRRFKRLKRAKQYAAGVAWKRYKGTR